MDLTIPYTFYPSALPHGVAWGLFTFAVLGSFFTSIAVSKAKSPLVGLLLFVPIASSFLVFTIVCSIVITFFIHDW